MKKIVIGLGALLVLLAVALVILVSQLDKVVKYTVETAGSEVTQVPVTLEKVNISAREGTASLSGFSVGNPEGFSMVPAISLGGISVTLDTASLGSDVIIVKEVSIDAPQVHYELIGKKTNIGTIQENIDRFANRMSSGSSSSTAEQQAEEPAPASDESSKKVIIENLYFREGKITVKADVLKEGEKEVTLPEIHLKDIGKKEGGYTANEVAAYLMKQVNQEIVDAVKDAQIEGMQTKLRDKINDKLKGWFGNDQ